MKKEIKELVDANEMSLEKFGKEGWFLKIKKIIILQQQQINFLDNKVKELERHVEWLFQENPKFKKYDIGWKLNEGEEPED